MRFRQKPPTQPGYYWALGNNDDSLSHVRVVEGSDGRLGVECDDDFGVGVDVLSQYRLWSSEPIAPVEPPAFKMPKRWINYHKPVKVALPPSCRRWGHKWVWDGEALAAYTESIKPKPSHVEGLDGDIFSVMCNPHDLYRSYSLIFGPDTFLKCSRCDAKDVYNSRTRNMFDNMFSTKYYDPSESASSITYESVQGVIEKMKSNML